MLLIVDRVQGLRLVEVIAKASGIDIRCRSEHNAIASSRKMMINLEETDQYLYHEGHQISSQPDSQALAVSRIF